MKEETTGFVEKSFLGLAKDKRKAATKSGKKEVVNYRHFYYSDMTTVALKVIVLPDPILQRLNNEQNRTRVRRNDRPTAHCCPAQKKPVKTYMLLAKAAKCKSKNHFQFIIIDL